MARRKKCQHEIHAVFVQELPVCYHTDKSQCTDDSNKVERLSCQQHYSYHTDKYQRNRAEDEITLQISQGEEPVTALIDSSQSRLRPVMMASLTTILGMIPLLPDAMFGSLAASIMGGLLFGTLITLLFIPILYALFFHIKKTDK